MLDNRLPKLLVDAGIATPEQASALLGLIQEANAQDTAGSAEGPMTPPPVGYEIPAPK